MSSSLVFEPALVPQPLWGGQRLPVAKANADVEANLRGDVGKSRVSRTSEDRFGGCSTCGPQKIRVARRQ